MNAGEKARILLVDDEPANLLVLETILRELGTDLVRARSGEEALQHLAERDFAAVLLDVRMPTLSGFETAQRIRAEPRSRATPIIFISAAEPDNFSVRDAYALGAIDYLVKPVVPEIVRAKVAVFVELFGLRQAERAEAAEVVRDREERLKLIVDHARDYAIVMTDPENRIVEWNSGAEQIMGWRAEEVVGQMPDLFFTPEDCASGQPKKEVLTAARTGRAEDKRWHLKKDGSRFFANGVMVALRDAGGKLRGFAKVLRDVTESKFAEERLRASEEQFRQAFVASGVGMALVSPAGKVLQVNPALCQMLGYSAPELLRLDVRALSHPDDLPADLEYADRLLAGDIPNYRIEKRYQHKDGSDVWAILTVTLVRNSSGAPDHFVSQVQDITHRKRNEEQLREASRRKDEFLAMLGHELRNPLAPLRNALGILRQPGVTGEQVSRVRDMMSRQVDQLGRLVDDLLDVSRITTGKVVLKKQPTELLSVITHAVETARPFVELRRHTLTVEAAPLPIWLDGDQVRLAQVVGNLLNNAAKYTDEGGHITLNAVREGGEAVIRVRDTGIGIAPELLPKVFDLFTQADAAHTRSGGGLGIGLTLVSRLVEMHGGSVRAKSEGLGNGSEFEVRLPVAAGSGSAAGAAEQMKPTGASRRILVVDDNVDSAESMAVYLELSGHEVRTVHDGLKVLDTVRSFRPHVVLLDIGLPGMNGYEVARRIRREFPTGRMLLVAMTGYGREEDRSLSAEAGFDRHLVKPVSLDAVQEVLRTLPVNRRREDSEEQTGARTG